MNRRNFIKLACLTPFAPLVTVCNKYPSFDPKEQIGRCFWFCDDADRDKYRNDAKKQAQLLVPSEHHGEVQYIEKQCEFEAPDPFQQWGYTGWIYTPKGTA